MSGPQRPAPSPGAIERSSRSELSWLDDGELQRMSYREASTSIALGVFTGGGGSFYNGDIKGGAVGIAAMIGTIALVSALPALTILPILGVSLWGAVRGYRQSSKINKYLFARQLSLSHAQGVNPSHRLLASMQSSTPPPPASSTMSKSEELAALPSLAGSPLQSALPKLCERMRKLAAIRASGVIDDHEFRSRKIDLLSQVASGLSCEDTDDLLYGLLPLLDEGVVSDEDMAFIKELGS